MIAIGVAHARFGTAAPAQVALTDDDTAAGLALSVDPATLAEGAGATDVTVTATLPGANSSGSDMVLSLNFSGSAAKGVDYILSGTESIAILTGASLGTTRLSVTPVDDAIDEGLGEIVEIGTTHNSNKVAAVLLLTDDDSGAPALSIEMAAWYVGADPIAVRFVFPEPVKGFASDDVTVSGGDLGVLSTKDGGRTYLSEVTPDTPIPASITVTVRKNAVTDWSGSTGPAAPVVKTAQYDVPTLEIEGLPSAFRGIEPLVLVFRFSEPVEFERSDVEVTNGRVTGFSGDGAVYVVEVTPAGGSELRVGVRRGAVADGAGNTVVPIPETAAPVDGELTLLRSIVRTPGRYLQSDPLLALPADMVVQGAEVRYQASLPQNSPLDANSVEYSYAFVRKQGDVQFLAQDDDGNTATNRFRADWYGENLVEVTATDTAGKTATALDRVFVHFAARRVLGGDAESLTKGQREGIWGIEHDLGGSLSKGMAYTVPDLSRGDATSDTIAKGFMFAKEQRLLKTSLGTLIVTTHAGRPNPNHHRDELPFGMAVVVSRSNDHGNSWEHTMLDQDEDDSWAYTALVEVGGEVHVYLNRQRALKKMRGMYVFKSSDDGRTWDRGARHNQLSGLYNIDFSPSSAYFNQAKPSTNILKVPGLALNGQTSSDGYGLLLHTYVSGGIFASLDRGTTWTKVARHSGHTGVTMSNEVAWTVLDNDAGDIYMIFRHNFSDWKREYVISREMDSGSAGLSFVAKHNKALQNLRSRTAHHWVATVRSGERRGRLLFSTPGGYTRNHLDLLVSRQPIRGAATVGRDLFDNARVMSRAGWGQSAVEYLESDMAHTHGMGGDAIVLVGESEPIHRETYQLIDLKPDLRAQDERLTTTAYALSWDYLDLLQDFWKTEARRSLSFESGEGWTGNADTSFTSFRSVTDRGGNTWTSSAGTVEIFKDWKTFSHGIQPDLIEARTGFQVLALGRNTSQASSVVLDPTGALGVVEASFYIKRFSGNSDKINLKVEYSVDQGSNWISVLDKDYAGSTIPSLFERVSARVGQRGDVRLRLTVEGAQGLLIDDVSVTPYRHVRAFPAIVSMSEKDGEATYEVVLSRAPTAAVTVEPTSEDTKVATVSGPLTFTPDNWSTAQTVTVTRVNDNAGDQGTTITHTVSSTDAGYDGLVAPPVTVTVVNRIDYDVDDDGLIEITKLEQLNAMRWDLNGDGDADSSSDDTVYADAFPTPVADAGALGCSNSQGAAACTGYELKTDLDFSKDGSYVDTTNKTNWTSSSGWGPVGDGSTWFTATFDGNGRSISNLFIARSGTKEIGLFGRVGPSAHLRNVVLEDAVVTGLEEVGTLVGELRGRIEGCSASGTAAGNKWVGGLVGNSEGGSISASHASIAVTGGSGGASGGLVGRNKGDVALSFAAGSVTGASYVGGLVGAQVGRRTLKSVYATGAVTGSGSLVGGLVGNNGGAITAGYATGVVSGSSDVGGLVGKNDGGSVTDSYWDTQTSGRTSSESGRGVGKSTTELQSPAGYKGIYANWNLDLDSDGDGDDPWDFGGATQYPALKADLDGNGVTSVTEFGDGFGHQTPRRGLAVSEAAVTVEEDSGTADYTVVLVSAPVANVVVEPVSGDTTAAAVSPPSLTFTPTDWGTAQAVTVTGVNDNFDNVGDRRTTITYTVSSMDTDYDNSPLPPLAVVVEDDDTAALALSVNPTTLAEDDSAVAVDVKVKASLSGATIHGDLVLPLTLDGTARAGVDYELDALPAITIAGGDTEATATLSITPLDDAIDEGNETITIGVAHARFGVAAPAQVVLTDNDNAAGLVLSVSLATLAEGDGATDVTVTAALTNGATAAEALVLRLRFAGTAERGDDYTVKGTKSIRIAKGTPSGSTTLTVMPISDDVDEGLGEIVEIGATHNGNKVAATLLLTDDDAGAPALSIEMAAGYVGAGAISVRFVFLEPVTDFASDDVTVSGGNLGALSTKDGGRTYASAVTPDGANRAITVTVKQDAVIDRSGNTGPAAPVAKTAQYDATVPTLEIEGLPSALRGTEPLVLVFRFSEPVEFERRDIKVANGRVTGFSGDGAVYVVEVTPAGGSELRVGVKRGAVADGAGNTVVPIPETAAPVDGELTLLRSIVRTPGRYLQSDPLLALPAGMVVQGAEVRYQASLPQNSPLDANSVEYSYAFVRKQGDVQFLAQDDDGNTATNRFRADWYGENLVEVTATDTVGKTATALDRVFVHFAARRVLGGDAESLTKGQREGIWGIEHDLGGSLSKGMAYTVPDLSRGDATSDTIAKGFMFAKEQRLLKTSLGTLIVTTHAGRPNPNHHRDELPFGMAVVVSRSNDHGNSWEHTMLDQDEDDSWAYTALVEVGGEVHVYLNRQRALKKMRGMYVFKSSDDGRTWDRGARHNQLSDLFNKDFSPSSAYFEQAKPSTNILKVPGLALNGQTSSDGYGLLLHTYVSGGIFASLDRGTTWTKVARHSGHTGVTMSNEVAWTVLDNDAGDIYMIFRHNFSDWKREYVISREMDSGSAGLSFVAKHNKALQNLRSRTAHHWVATVRSGERRGRLLFSTPGGYTRNHLDLLVSRQPIRGAATVGRDLFDNARVMSRAGWGQSAVEYLESDMAHTHGMGGDAIVLVGESEPIHRETYQLIDLKPDLRAQDERLTTTAYALSWDYLDLLQDFWKTEARRSLSFESGEGWTGNADTSFTSFRSVTDRGGNTWTSSAGTVEIFKDWETFTHGIQPDLTEARTGFQVLALGRNTSQASSVVLDPTGALGVVEASFYIKRFSGNSDKINLKVEYSVDQGGNWISVLDKDYTGSTIPSLFERVSARVGQRGDVRLRLTVEGAQGLLIDDVSVTPYRHVRASPAIVSMLENGGEATYEVVLSRAPTTAVTVEPTSEDTKVVTVSGPLTFTPDNWREAQKVTVTGVEDLDDNSGQKRTTSITHTVSSMDAGYNELAAPVVTVTVTVVNRIDYDVDDDGLIEITKLEQLNAMRWDLNGDGDADSSSDDTVYADAFPTPVAGAGALGCSNSQGAAACTGYELKTDLDFSKDGSYVDTTNKTNWTSSSGWGPVGDGSTWFTATFDGNGRSISNLFIARSGTKEIGLFGRVGSSAHLRNVVLEDAVVTGLEEVGTLVGELQGRIEGCSASGTAAGNKWVGGLVGNSEGGSVSASYASVAVTGGSGGASGGLVGRNKGDVALSFAAGSVTGTSYVGGLVGAQVGRRTLKAVYATGAVMGSGSKVGGLAGNNEGAITAGYATGAVNGSSDVGGLVGKNDGGSVTDSYWDTQTSGRTSSESGRGVGKSTDELQSPTGYTRIYANWNLDLDSNGASDDPWDFGNATQYPALKADLDDNRKASVAEFGGGLGHQTPRPGLAVSETAVTVREDGGTADYTVVLVSAPVANVVVALASGDTAAAAVAPPSLRFTPTDWSTAQAVMVTGVNDSIDNAGDVRETAITYTVRSADLDYNNIAVPQLAVVVADDDTATLALSVSPTTLAEDDSAVEVTVRARLSGAAIHGDLVLPLMLGGTARAGADYEVDALPAITIAGGNTTATAPLSITPLDDAIDEGDETITIGVAQAWFGATAPAQVTLTDNDTAAGLVLSVSPATLAEGDGATNVTVTATLPGANSSGSNVVLPLNFAGSAAKGVDYILSGTESIAILMGTSSGDTTLTITPTDDAIDEGLGEIVEIGTTHNGNKVAAALLLTDDDAGAPALSIEMAAGYVRADAIPVRFVFSEPVTGFASGDVVVSAGGTLGTLSTKDGGRTYASAVTPDNPLPASITVTVRRNAVTDGSGRTGPAAPVVKTAQSDVPTLEIEGLPSAFRGTEPLVLVFRFSEPVEFERRDIKVANGRVTGFSGDGAVYVVEVTPNGGSELRVGVKRGAVADGAGNTVVPIPKTAAPVDGELTLLRSIVRTPGRYLQSDPLLALPTGMVVQGAEVHYQASLPQNSPLDANSVEYSYAFVRKQGDVEFLAQDDDGNTATNRFRADWYGENLVEVTATDTAGKTATALDRVFVHFAARRVLGGDAESLTKGQRESIWEIEHDLGGSLSKGMAYTVPDLSRGDATSDTIAKGFMFAKEQRLLKTSLGTLIVTTHAGRPNPTHHRDELPFGMAVVVSRSDDHGNSWEHTMLAQDEDDSWAYTALVEVGGEVHVYLNRQRALKAMRGMYVFKSSDDGRTWDRGARHNQLSGLFNRDFSPSDKYFEQAKPSTNILKVPSLALNGQTSSDGYGLLLHTYVSGGIFASLDRGTTWTKVASHSGHTGVTMSNEVAWTVLDNAAGDIYMIFRHNSSDWKREYVISREMDSGNAGLSFVAKHDKALQNLRSRTAHHWVTTVRSGERRGRLLFSTPGGYTRNHLDLLVSRQPIRGAATVGRDLFDNARVMSRAGWGQSAVEYLESDMAHTHGMGGDAIMLVGESEPIHRETYQLIDLKPDLRAQDERLTTTAYALSWDYLDLLQGFWKTEARRSLSFESGEGWTGNTDKSFTSFHSATDGGGNTWTSSAGAVEIFKGWKTFSHGIQPDFIEARTGFQVLALGRNTSQASSVVLDPTGALGVVEASFYIKRFSGNSDRINLKVEYSVDQGSNWISVLDKDYAGSTIPSLFERVSARVGQRGDVQLRLTVEGEKGLLIDDVSVIPYRHVRASPAIVSVSEKDGEATYEVVLSRAPTAAVTVEPTSGDSTVATVPSTPLTFTKTNWNIAQMVTVKGVNDNIYNAEHRATTITHTVSSVGDSDYNSVTAPSVVVTVTDDDTATLALGVNPTTLAEDAVATEVTVTATLLGAALDAELTLPLALVGTALAGVDYEVSGTLPMLAISKGDTSATARLMIDPVDDAVDEGASEMIAIGVAHARFGETAPAQVALTDNDDAGLTLVLDQTTLAEDAVATVVTVTAALSRVNDSGADVELPLNFAGSAAKSVDYTLSGTGSITISAGASAGDTRLTITPTDDAIDEGLGEIVEVGTTHKGNKVAVALFLTDDDAGAPALSIEMAAGYSSTDPIAVRFVFPEPVTGFASDDVTVSAGGTLGTLSTTDGGRTYASEVTPDGMNRAITVTVRRDAVTDRSGSTGPAAPVVKTARYDATVPTLVIEGLPSAFHGTRPLVLVFRFSEPVEFERSDVEVANGGVTDFSGDGAVYKVVVTPAGGGELRVGVKRGAVADGAGNTVAATSETAALADGELTLSKRIVRTPGRYLHSFDGHLLPMGMVVQGAEVRYQASLPQNSPLDEVSTTYSYAFVRKQGDVEFLARDDDGNTAANRFRADWYGENLIEVTATDGNGKKATALDKVFVHFASRRVLGGDAEGLTGGERAAVQTDATHDIRKLVGSGRGMAYRPANIAANEGAGIPAKGFNKVTEPRLLSTSRGTLLVAAHAGHLRAHEAPPGQGIMVSRSTDHGNSWSELLLVQKADETWGYTAMTEVDGVVYIYASAGNDRLDTTKYNLDRRGIYYFKSTDDGLNWGPPIRHDGLSNAIGYKDGDISSVDGLRLSTNILKVPGLTVDGATAPAGRGLLLHTYVDGYVFASVNGGVDWTRVASAVSYKNNNSIVSSAGESIQLWDEFAWAVLGNNDRDIYVLVRDDPPDYKDEYVISRVMTSGDFGLQFKGAHGQALQNVRAQNAHHWLTSVKTGAHAGTLLFSAPYHDNHRHKRYNTVLLVSKRAIAGTDSVGSNLFDVADVKRGVGWGQSAVEYLAANLPSPLAAGMGKDAIVLVGESEPVHKETHQIIDLGATTLAQWDERYTVTAYTLSWDYLETLLNQSEVTLMVTSGAVLREDGAPHDVEVQAQLTSTLPFDLVLPLEFAGAAVEDVDYRVAGDKRIVIPKNNLSGIVTLSITPLADVLDEGFELIEIRAASVPGISTFAVVLDPGLGFSSFESWEGWSGYPRQLAPTVFTASPFTDAADNVWTSSVAKIMNRDEKEVRTGRQSLALSYGSSSRQGVVLDPAGADGVGVVSFYVKRFSDDTRSINLRVEYRVGQDGAWTQTFSQDYSSGDIPSLFTEVRVPINQVGDVQLQFSVAGVKGFLIDDVSVTSHK